MNISTLKTPGVYINEIDAFPPSVAQVATAIPAFIGFTEKAPAPRAPKRIKSLLEYQEIFGGAPKPGNIQVFLDENKNPTDASGITDSKYVLYNSLQLFYANGGGVCFVHSIGSYEEDISEEAFISGLDSIAKEDEPTLLLFPMLLLFLIQPWEKSKKKPWRSVKH
jgi:phage tail sheath protein FI